MKKYYLIVLILFTNQACSNPPYNSEVYNSQNTIENQTCSFVLNEFKKVKNYPVSIPVQKGYEKLAKKDYLNSNKLYFSNLLHNLSIVKYPYIDKRCNYLNKILHNEAQIKRFQKKWLNEYLHVLQISGKKAKFRRTDKCYSFARAYYKLLIDKNPNIEIAKIQYNDCLQINLGRK